MAKKQKEASMTVRTTPLCERKASANMAFFKWGSLAIFIIIFILAGLITWVFEKMTTILAIIFIIILVIGISFIFLASPVVEARRRSCEEKEFHRLS